jgi:YgiT-type zinc finger domain-containing protein
MRCVICRGAEVEDRLTSVKLERGEVRLVVSNVPARVCATCGESYIAEAIAARLLQDAEEALEAGILERAIKFTIRPEAL